MAHVQGSYIGLWKPQNLTVDKISSQKMFVDNIDMLEAFSLSVIKRSVVPVTTIGALRAIDTSNTSIYIDGTTAMVKSNGLYFFDRSNTSADNGSTIIAPTTGGGRWVSINTFLGSLAFKDTITKSDIGLGNVPNVATNDQTPTFTASSTLVTLTSGEKLSTSFGKISKAITDLILHLSSKANPHGVTATQIGLGKVDNTADLDKPISTAVQAALDNIGGGNSNTLVELNNHKNNNTNPHSVTKSQVGLGNVDNTSDANKPVSTAQATAIADAKKAGTDAQTNLIAHADTKTNPHGVTATQVGLGNVPNVTTNDQTPTFTQASTLATLTSGERLTVSFGKIMKAITDLISHLSSKANPHSVTKSQVGLGNVDNTADTDKPVSTAQATAIADAKKSGTDAQGNLTTHINTKTNPHSVTKAHVGLGNVDNTSDANKPVSTAQATAIADAKKAGTDAQTNLTSHAETKTNPHGVTATQVGLGNVPNVTTNNQTPTFTQASTLANIVSGEKLSVSLGKIMKAIADFISHLSNKTNPHGVTAAQVGAVPIVFSANSTSTNEDDLDAILSTAINAMPDNSTRVIRVNFSMQHEHFVSGITAVITVFRVSSTYGCAIASTCSSGYPEILIKGLSSGVWGSWRNATSATANALANAEVIE